MINEVDFVELGLFCASICQVLERGMSGGGSANPLYAIEQSKTRVTYITDVSARRFTTLSIAGPWLGSGLHRQTKQTGRVLPTLPREGQRQSHCCRRSKLDKIPRVIAVRAFAWIRQPLTFWFQTELEHPCRCIRPPLPTVRCFKFRASVSGTG